MTEPFSAQPVLDGLTGFQRATVAHVMDRFFGPSPTKRFLTADETGLGKSLVARGVIASLIERLQDDDSVDRIDIIYVCSNADIAEQNLRRLNVTGEDHLPFASRLTMLAKESHRLKGQAVTGLKPVNLVSFTPGTSFATGHSGGRVEEHKRARRRMCWWRASRPRSTIPSPHPAPPAIYYFITWPIKPCYWC